jgi:hypothetical protein
MDLVTAAVLVVGAALVLMFGRAQLARSFILPLVVLLLTFLALPHGMGPGTLVDIRVPAALLFILIAASRVSFRRLVVARAFAGLVGALLLVKIAGLSWSWLAFDTLVGQYIAAFDRLAPESTLFVARQAVPRSWAQRMYVDRVREPPHVASLAALREDVFVPSLFAAPGAQPIELQPRFARMNAYQGFWAVEVGTEEPLDEAVDTFIGLQREASPSKAAYLLLFDRATPPLAPPDDARLIAAGPGFRLFEIYTPPGRG